MNAIDSADLWAVDRLVEDDGLGLALAGEGLLALRREALTEAGLAWTTGESIRSYVLTRCGLSFSILRESSPERILEAARHLCELLAEAPR